MISTYLSGTFFISNCNVPLFDRLYFLSLKMTFLEALFWDFSTNDTFLYSEPKKIYKIPRSARPDNT